MIIYGLFYDFLRISIEKIIIIFYNMDKTIYGCVVVRRKRRVYFHTNLESESNIALDTVPLAVNAVGVEYFYKPFKAIGLRFDYSVVYVTEGVLDLWYNRNHIQVKKGCFVITEPGKQSGHGTNCENLNYFWLNFTGSKACELIKKMKLECYTVYNIGVYEEIKSSYMRMAGEFTLNDSLFPDTSVAILTEIMALLSRRVNVTDKAFIHSAEYIEAHYNEEIKIEQLALLEGLSVSHYRMIFKKRFNTTPNEYITMKRINSACFYLRYSKRSVERIAELVGYNDSFYFSRVFKKKIGVSPSKYRRDCKI